jgi:hypothetical protein
MIAEPVYAYRPFCRFKVEQTYDFNETIEGEPFSPIFARLDLTAGSLLSLNADAEWSTYDSSFLNQNIALRAADKRGDRFFCNIDMTKGFAGNLLWNAIINLHERIAMFTEYERNIKDGKPFCMVSVFCIWPPAGHWISDMPMKKETKNMRSWSISMVWAV